MSGWWRRNDVMIKQNIIVIGIRHNKIVLIEYKSRVRMMLWRQ